MNLSTDRVHTITLPSVIRKELFNTLIIDANVIECRVFLFWEKMLLFGMNNLNDSLSCVFTFENKEKTQNNNIKEETSWGTAHQLMLLSPSEIKNRKLDFPLKKEKNAIPFVHFFRKEIKIESKLDFKIELFVRKHEKVKTKQM